MYWNDVLMGISCFVTYELYPKIDLYSRELRDEMDYYMFLFKMKTIYDLYVIYRETNNYIIFKGLRINGEQKLADLPATVRKVQSGDCLLYNDIEYKILRVTNFFNEMQSYLIYYSDYVVNEEPSGRTLEDVEFRITLDMLDIDGGEDE